MDLVSWQVALEYKGAKMWGKPHWHRFFPCANDFCCTFSYDVREDCATNQRIDRAETRTVKEVILSDPVDYVHPMYIIKNTTHRDGAIHKSNFGLLKSHHITERDETRLEPMELSGPTDDCHPDWERCIVHYSSHMMQIFSLKLAQIPIDRNPVELYGYIAVRDCRDSLLNYIVNCSRDDPITVQQGSLIEMTGPKRGISMRFSVLLEFDMRIRNGGKEEDDLQLIDGASEVSELTTPRRPYTERINGESGAVDITLAFLHKAVEATIEVVISEVHSCFSLSLSSLVFIRGLQKEIQLFHGTIGESCALRRFVIAVRIDTWMHLKFRIGQKGSRTDLEHYCSFEANNHGCADQQIMFDVACVSAKVTWSTVPF
ncbi:unnamed protein product [Urochloa decumbens]|uniref:DUF6598 domain-containing protein n=1 Tax=Urochloa decumbens TaxID=240449 RepID=A0ABC8V8I8_9POAL